MMPYILSIIGVTALLIIGRNHWAGWILAFTNECLWIGFAITTKQYGFILGAVFYGTVNAYNAIRWRNLKREVAQAYEEVVSQALLAHFESHNPAHNKRHLN